MSQTLLQTLRIHQMDMRDEEKSQGELRTQSSDKVTLRQRPSGREQTTQAVFEARAFEGEIAVSTETLWAHAWCTGRQGAGEPGAERAKKSHYEALGSEIVQGV